MKMRLKSRQTTVSTTPTTASADITENRMTSIKNTSSLGIPAGYREMGGERKGEEGRGEGGGQGRERRGRHRGKGRGRKGEAGREEERGRVKELEEW